MIYNETSQEITKTLAALRANNMQAVFVSDGAAAYAYAEKLLFDGAVIACGGSQSVKQCGLDKLFKNGKYRFLDRSAVSLAEAPALYRESFFSDFYFTSANAITEDGELFNVDGNSNRIAAYCYGPKNVIVIAGCNKLVKNLTAAVARLRSIAAPMNTRRLGCATPCRETGECIALGSAAMTSGCNGDGRICCNYLISAKQREKDRIKVILVGEELGF